MEDVIRVREIRKSMEQSGHFFTPICSPMEQPSTNGTASGKRFQFPSSTPRNCDLYMTLDLSPEEPIRRKKSSGEGIKPKRTLRNKLHDSVVLDDSVASSANSSTVGESSTSSTPDNNQRRVFKRKLIF